MEMGFARSRSGYLGNEHKEESMKCQHGPCRCRSMEGSNFCSDHCQFHIGSQDIETSSLVDEGEAIGGCGCGHPECIRNPMM